MRILNNNLKDKSQIIYKDFTGKATTKKSMHELIMLKRYYMTENHIGVIKVVKLKNQYKLIVSVE